ncbi:MAG: hypothetical protein PHV12_01205 [Bacteroidales bacterium]|nr:hypothetical protein [Bacteroidales bacterium]
MKENQSQSNIEEQYSQKPIPGSMRKSWFYPSSVFLGMCAVLASSMAGGSLISGLTFLESIVAMVLGLLALLIFIYVPLGKIGAEQGLNPYFIGECAFGKRGSDFLTAFIVTIIPAAAWYGIQVSIATQALAAVFPMSKLVFNIVTIIFGTVFAIPAAYGLLSMAWLNWISLPVMIYVIIFGVFKALNVSGMEGILAYTPETNMGILWGINMQIGMIAIGCCSVSDFTRWIKNKWNDVTYSGLAGLFPATIVLGIAGMMMALTSAQYGVTESWNIIEVLISLKMPAMALILVFLLQWTTCITSVYSSSLALHKVFGGNRFYLAFLFAAGGTVLAIINIMSKFLGFVSLLANWVPPIAGVIIAEYYFVSKGNFKRREAIYWPGVVSVIIGGLIASKLTFFIPAINGLIISAVIYFVYHKILGLITVSKTSKDEVL